MRTRGCDDNNAMGPLLIWIEQNLEKDLSLPAIAWPASMSTRTLTRRFLDIVGTTPAQWIATARVRRAQQLLETTTLPVEEVAARAGFGSVSVLRAHFAGIAGTSPVAYRRTFSSSRS